MRIGIDLDGVVFNTEREYRVYSELYDMIDLKQNSKIDGKEMGRTEAFKWTTEEFEGFLKRYHKKVTQEASYMPGAQEVLKLLKEEGHTLVVITARGVLNQDMIKITEERLKQDNMDIFDKYYWKTENKEEVCKKENIDVMIDDSYKKCESTSKNKIKTIYFQDAETYDLEENEYLKVLYNWGEIYRYLKEIEK